MDLVRKAKEMMEKKQADAEPFLLSIANSPAATVFLFLGIFKNSENALFPKFSWTIIVPLKIAHF